MDPEVQVVREVQVVQEAPADQVAQEDPGDLVLVKQQNQLKIHQVGNKSC